MKSVHQCFFEHVLIAATMLRFQLDAALRFHAAFLVEHPHEFALAVLRGDRVRDMKDRAQNPPRRSTRDDPVDKTVSYAPS
jgi:hypothetical protein